jgi:hypothetical protein
MKVVIGCNAPQRVSMFERRDGLGGFHHTLPPITGDAATLQAALLAKPRPVSWLLRMLKGQK